MWACGIQPRAFLGQLIVALLCVWLGRDNFDKVLIAILEVSHQPDHTTICPLGMSRESVNSVVPICLSSVCGYKQGIVTAPCEPTIPSVYPRFPVLHQKHRGVVGGIHRGF